MTSARRWPRCAWRWRRSGPWPASPAAVRRPSPWARAWSCWGTWTVRGRPTSGPGPRASTPRARPRPWGWRWGASMTGTSGGPRPPSPRRDSRRGFPSSMRSSGTRPAATSLRATRRAGAAPGCRPSQPCWPRTTAPPGSRRRGSSPPTRAAMRRAPWKPRPGWERPLSGSRRLVWPRRTPLRIWPRVSSRRP